jgi:hypothetical protein
MFGWLKTFFHWLGTWRINWGFLKENSEYSLMRLGVTFILLTFWPPFLILWVWFSIASMTLVAIPPSVQWLLGIAFGAKAGQKAIEILPDVVGRYRERKRAEKNDDWDTSTSHDEEQPTEPDQVKGQ